MRGLWRRLKQPEPERRDEVERRKSEATATSATTTSDATTEDATLAATDVAFRVWGCRGSLPSPGPTTVRYGGETTCFEISCGASRLFIDCGSGLRRLGRKLIEDGDDRPIEILLTHFHADHLLGLGFFEPLLFETAPVTLWSSRSVDETRRGLDSLFSPPTWPITITDRTGLLVGQLFPSVSRLDAFDVRHFKLNHPGGATGYRIEVEGRAIVIVTDHETGDDVFDDDIVAAAMDADLLVFDAPYDDAEYERRRGWGHSPRSQALRIADACRARHLLITHHEPSAGDDALDAIAATLKRAGGDVALAAEGAVLRL